MHKNLTLGGEQQLEIVSNTPSTKEQKERLMSDHLVGEVITCQHDDH